MTRLKDKVALITGASTGLGRRISSLFASEGAQVVATDINEADLGLIKEYTDPRNFSVHTIVADMSSQKDIEAAVDETIRKYGKIDILVNNAGIMDNYTPLSEVKDILWDKVMAINLNGPFYATRRALQSMVAAKSGTIINIASIAGLYGARAGTAYTVSKHGLIGMTKNVGYIYAEQGIRCNAIAPGRMESCEDHDIDYTRISPLVRESIPEGLALNPRISRPTEIARIALFLASDEASFINGEVIVGDGGWTAY